MQQIEVLRGPQGTLFGKNSVGGAVNITTVKPQPDLEAFTMVRPGNLNGLDTRGHAERSGRRGSPAEPRLVLHDAARRLRPRPDPGRATTATRTTWSSWAACVSLASDDLTFDLSGTWSKSHTNGQGGPCIVVREDGPVASLFPGLFPACRATSAFSWSSEVAGLSDIETAGTWGVLNYNIGNAGVFENLAIKAIGSWNHQTTRLRFDVDGTDQFVTLSLDRRPTSAQRLARPGAAGVR